ncbi:MAG: molybdopterin cofactor-binding domain-containing protein [Roseibium sp.]|uniref:xanthine dehydrogenase family protein molybdopterin-binding subunit n=1 Tax=Roseibium sp. TaxID=1936156 RepID=UPI003D9C534F
MKIEFSPSRRGFLAGTGALGFAVLASGGVRAFRGEAHADSVNVTEVNAWVSIHSDNRVTVRFAPTEMGQGVSTSLPMILAEELDADWNMIDSRQVDNGPLDVFGNPKIAGILYTAGSTSIEAYFDTMRCAGAGARKILVLSAANAWEVPASEITTAESKLTHPKSERSMTYGAAASLPELVADIGEIGEADFKPRNQWRIIGSDVARLDVPAKTRGESEYSIDVRLPDMAYAVQLLSPVEGETPTSVSDSAARAVPGVIDIIRLENSVNIVAETLESAIAGRDLLEVTWSETSRFRSADSETERRQAVEAAEDTTREAVIWHSQGDAKTAFDTSGLRTVSATYATEPVYHAQMEPLCAVASVDEDGKGAEVWLGTQSQSVSILVASKVLQTTPDRIRFHAMQMGGGFGRRTVFARHMLRDALLISKSVRRPVKMMWTREDDVKNGWFRPATAHHFTASLNADGDLIALRHRLASPSILQFAMPNIWEKVNGRDLLVMEGSESHDYDIPNLLTEHINTERQSRISAWRGIGAGTICFARECFIDELAERVGSDPVRFRRQLLAESPRGLKVLDEVLEMSNFGQAREGRAHGLSFAGYKESRGAGVAEVSVDPDSGQIRVHRFWAAVDPGIAVHPDNLKAQIEGGIMYGLSGLKRERIGFSGGVVDQSNFYDYEVMRIDEAPDIQVQIVPSDAGPTGAGELGVPMTGGAVANAVYALTGNRLRHMPFERA